MILAGLVLELVYQLVSFGGIAVLSGEIAVLSEEIALKLGEIGGVLGSCLVKPQAVFEDFVLLLQHPEPSGLVLAVIELLGGLVDQLVPLELHSAACSSSSLSFSGLTPVGCSQPHPPVPTLYWGVCDQMVVTELILERIRR